MHLNPKDIFGQRTVSDMTLLRHLWLRDSNQCLQPMVLKGKRNNNLQNACKNTRAEPLLLTEKLVPGHCETKTES